MRAGVRARAESRRRTIFTLVAALWALVVVLPVVWMALMMFKPETIMFARPPVWLFAPTLEHFDYVLAHGFVWNLGASLVIALVSTLLVVVVGTPAAYAFARFPIRRRDDLLLFVLATRMAPPIALAIPFYLIYAKVGLLDTYVGLVVAYLTFNLSFYIWVLWSFCRELPVELEEAARADGYSRTHVLLRVVLPLLRPGIIATAVLCFIFAWNEFLYAFLLGGKAVETLPVAVPKLITSQGVKWGELAVVGIVALLPVLLVVFLLQRHIVRGLTMGAVKG
ncbi:MAG TPA: carbohydrate ABC transporter permease [Methylomirabilota bacterium]|jgi:multiple sugar transport system permease protein